MFTIVSIVFHVAFVLGVHSSISSEADLATPEMRVAFEAFKERHGLEAKGHENNLVQKDTSKTANISQHEYVFKHNLIFEQSHREANLILRQGREIARGYPRNELLVLTSQNSSQPFRSFKGNGTEEFHYNTNIPELQNSGDTIYEVLSAELRFLLKPQTCTQPSKVKFALTGQKDVTTMYVDACDSRWVSLDLEARAIHPGQQTHIGITCKDCTSEKVEISEPFLNIIAEKSQKKRLRRNARQMVKKTDCVDSLSPLHMEFSRYYEYNAIDTPKVVNIQMCIGKCTPNSEGPHRAWHTRLNLLMNRWNRTSHTLCCTPVKFRNFIYLRFVNKMAVQTTVEDSIAMGCDCK